MKVNIISSHISNIDYFFQNAEILIQLDKLDNWTESSMHEQDSIVADI